MDSTTGRIQSAGSHFEIDNQVSDWHSKYGYYRLIIASSSTIKYLAEPDPVPSFPDIRGEKLDFTTVPNGDWNIGYLTPQPGTRKYSLAYTEKINLAGVTNIWHPQIIDWMALNELDHGETKSPRKSRGQPWGRVFKNHFGFERVVVHYNWIPGPVHSVDQETKIYSLIDGHQIAPKFLAHVTEKSSDDSGSGERVIGFMVEEVANVRPATLQDVTACKEVLAKLHALGIAHGFLRPEFFLISDGEREGAATSALVQSFAGAYQTSDQTLLNAEMEGLELAFQQATIVNDREQRKCFYLNIEMSAEIRAVSIRDGGLHPHVIQQAKEGKITITEEEHRALLADWKREEMSSMRARWGAEGG